MTSRLGEMFGSGRVETFLGLPRCDLGGPLPEGVPAVLFGADTATPYGSVGAYCAGGAAAIRAGAADFAANLGHMNFDLGTATFAGAGMPCDAGDLPIDPGDAEGNRGRIRQATSRILAAGAVPVLLGGDDSLPIPMLGAFGATGRRYTIVQVDAHIDWRDEVQGERLGLSSTMRRASEMEHVSRIVQIGQRGIGSAREADLADAKDWGVRFFPMRSVARSGVAPAIEAVEPGADVLLCFDWDAMDPSVMPAVIARTPGGLDYWSAFELIAGVAGKARIAGICFAEFMPDQDIDGQGARLAAQLVAASLGLVARTAGRVYQAPE